jgi:hypothetical protein
MFLYIVNGQCLLLDWVFVCSKKIPYLCTLNINHILTVNVCAFISRVFDIGANTSLYILKYIVRL